MPRYEGGLKITHVARWAQFVLVLLLVALISPVTGMAQAPESLRILYTPAFTGHLPALIANDEGFFTRNGLKVDLIGSAEPLRPLLSGDVDLALPAPAVAMVAVTQGQHLKIIMSVQGRITQQLLVTPEVARSLKSAPGDFPAVVRELQGKKLGVSVRGGSVDLDLRYILTSAGLTPDKDVFVIAAGTGGAMVAGLRAKQLDGILGFPPLTQELLVEGAAVDILNLSKGQGPAALRQPFVVAAVTDAFLQQHEDTAKRFVTAMVQTMAFIRNTRNRNQVKKDVAARLTGIDPVVLDSVVTELIATMDPTFSQTALNNVNELLKVEGVLTQPIAYNDVVAKDLVPTHR